MEEVILNDERGILNFEHDSDYTDQKKKNDSQVHSDFKFQSLTDSVQGDSERQREKEKQMTQRNRVTQRNTDGGTRRVRVTQGYRVYDITTEARSW